MKKTTITLGASALVLGGLMFGTSLVEAYRGDPSVQGPNYTPERHQSMEQAFENNDYNTWKKLMSDKGKVTQLVTEENFQRFAEAHQLAKEGKLDEARQIRQELGLGQGRRNSNGSGQGNRGQDIGGGWNR